MAVDLDTTNVMFVTKLMWHFPKVLAVFEREAY